jgi:hypothetical protein
MDVRAYLLCTLCRMFMGLSWLSFAAASRAYGLTASLPIVPSGAGNQTALEDPLYISISSIDTGLRSIISCPPLLLTMVSPVLSTSSLYILSHALHPRFRLCRQPVRQAKSQE